MKASAVALAWLVASAAGAQAPEPMTDPAALRTAPASVVPPEPAAPAPSVAPTPSAVPAPPAVPKYSASQITTIFNYLDRNQDGKISREEAAGFKGVARNFDRADTNVDGSLSADEFTFAMNRAR